jgi:hypothetical protein
MTACAQHLCKLHEHPGSQAEHLCRDQTDGFLRAGPISMLPYRSKRDGIRTDYELDSGRLKPGRPLERQIASCASGVSEMQQELQSLPVPAKDKVCLGQALCHDRAPGIIGRKQRLGS